MRGNDILRLSSLGLLAAALALGCVRQRTEIAAHDPILPGAGGAEDPLIFPTRELKGREHRLPVGAVTLWAPDLGHREILEREPRVQAALAQLLEHRGQLASGTSGYVFQVVPSLRDLTATAEAIAAGTGSQAREASVILEAVATGAALLDKGATDLIAGRLEAESFAQLVARVRVRLVAAQALAASAPAPTAESTPSPGEPGLGDDPFAGLSTTLAEVGTRLADVLFPLEQLEGFLVAESQALSAARAEIARDVELLYDPAWVALGLRADGRPYAALAGPGGAPLAARAVSYAERGGVFTFTLDGLPARGHAWARRPLTFRCARNRLAEPHLISYACAVLTASGARAGRASLLGYAGS